MYSELQKQHIVNVTSDSRNNSDDGTHENLIRNSWRRCHQEYKLDPGLTHHAHVLNSTELVPHKERIEDFLRVARTGMEALYKQIASLNYVLLLADYEGVTVDYIGDRKYDNELKQAGLYLGTSWKESYAGTNAIGTCLSTGRPLICHKTDHFHVANIDLTCTAAPIFAPDGNLLAILDVSSMNSPLMKESQYLALQLVMVHARMIESANFLRHFSGNWVLRYARTPVFVDVIKENLIAINEDGTIMGATQSAVNDLRKNLSVKDIIGNSISDHFEISIEKLLSGSFSSENLTNNTLIVNGSDELFYVDLIRPKRKESLRSLPGFVSGHHDAFDLLAGNDRLMESAINKARRFADKNVNIVITGETGTGKELMARAIHKSSVRSIRPFVAINCAALPESLIESELFGFKEGSFTDAAKKGRKGLIMQSDGGTLFLDEISDMPLSLQSRLLRVLAEKEVLALGTEKPKKVDLHVISASHRDLRMLIAEGSFREDLYYRLNGATLELPALRHRQDKSFVIANILEQESESDDKNVPVTISDEALDLIDNYSWPGNCRQLRNALRAAVSLCEDGVIRPGDLPEEILRDESSTSVYPAAGARNETHPAKMQPGGVYTEKFTMLMELLTKHKWNITKVANELNVSRSTIYRQMEKYGIIAPNNR